MSVLSKAAALLDGASPSDLDRMSPAERRRLADLLWAWHRIAERRERVAALQATVRPAPPKAGVLAHLYDGERAP
jgi:hypothetical protein